MAKHFPLIHELEETSENLEHHIRSILEICNEIQSKQIKRYINNLLTSCYSEEPKIKWSSLWILCAILEKHKPELDLNTLGGVMSLSESLLVNVENEIYRSLGIEIFCSVIRCISKQNTLGREVVGHLNKIYKRLIPNDRLYNLQYVKIIVCGILNLPNQLRIFSNKLESQTIQHLYQKRNDKDLYLLYSLLPQLSASPSKRWNKLILYLLEIINTQHNILLKDLEKINGRSEFVSKRNDQLFSKGSLIESKYDLRINSFKIKNPECLIENCTTCIQYMLLNIPSQVSLQIPVLCPVEHLVFLSTRTLNLRVSFLKLKNNKKKMKKLNLQDNINYQTINSIQQSGANLIKILTQSISKNNLMLYLNPLLSSLLRSLNRKLPKEITASPNWRNTLIDALSHLVSKAGNSVPTWAIVKIGDWLLLQITAFSQNSLLAKNGFKLIKNYLTHCSKYIPIQTWIQIDKELLKIALELKNFGLEKKNIFVHVCKAIVSSLAAPRAVVPPFLGIALDLFKNEEHPIFKKGRKLASLLITPRSIPLSESVNENWSKFSLLDFFATSSNETNEKTIKQNDSDDYNDEEYENKKSKKKKKEKEKEQEKEKKKKAN
ncbi:proline- glutamic acid- and leucine-rich protein [Anaeramoeba flamelloides]|uniref:Proline- glutamic acid- and leucine-rich protein n=1 Tax=Anaeramoeba flamelloides TaxID=1746091 RepID=A0AAV7ZXY5_9EUKA|nr:proline- glutamic acid- and leucine-rich protein [Anaeramoeba flamelloides]